MVKKNQDIFLFFKFKFKYQLNTLFIELCNIGAVCQATGDISVRNTTLKWIKMQLKVQNLCPFF